MLTTEHQPPLVEAAEGEENIAPPITRTPKTPMKAVTNAPAKPSRPRIPKKKDGSVIHF